MFDVPPKYELKAQQVFPIVEKLLNNTFIIYSSKESEAECHECKKMPHDPKSLLYSAAGRGIPLLQSTAHYFMSKFIPLKRFSSPQNKEPFNEKVNYEDYCTVWKHISIEYSTYILQYPSEQVVVFYHSVMPIVDYEYEGIVYRWVYQNKCALGKYKFTLLRLGPNHGVFID